MLSFVFPVEGGWGELQCISLNLKCMYCYSSQLGVERLFAIIFLWMLLPMRLKMRPAQLMEKLPES